MSSSDQGNTIDWKPLPQRKRRNRRGNEWKMKDKMQNEVGDNHNEGSTAYNFEYLDHTADVQLHSWGNNLKEALENLVPCMINYMTDLKRVDIDKSKSVRINAHGEDLLSLVFHFLDEFLFSFHSEDFISAKINIETLDLKNYVIEAVGFGEEFNLNKHSQGTEVKAITYSNMQVKDNCGTAEDKAHIFVIVDI